MTKESSSLLLLDTNVLIALAWPNHQFHVAATRFLASGRSRWATCVLTQLGFIRLSSNPAAIATAKSALEAAQLLEVMVSDPLHIYLDSMPAALGKEAAAYYRRMLGHNQITDAYLIQLAIRNRAVLVTFDRRLKELAGDTVRLELLS